MNQLEDGVVKKVSFHAIPVELQSVAVAYGFVHVSHLVVDEGQTQNGNSVVNGLLGAQQTAVA